MKNLEQVTIEELERENKELRAHVERLRKIADMVGMQDAYIDYDFKYKVLNETPVQSLAEVERDAIIEVTQESLNDLDIEHVTPARKEYVKQGILLLAKTIEQNANKLLSEVE